MTDCPNCQGVYEDIVGVSEVAQGLDVSLIRVQRWIERREATNCPRPVRMIKAGHLYSMCEWRLWYTLWVSTRMNRWGMDARRRNKS